ncbi:Protein OPY2 [Lachnellula hyalina]|uniref:Protein OPY2 n=1 Tax=Lachnellula hyalina TaxID=1316788 RepID=A0A8H8U119_9HELO|nr:Protein OPY2 [Lachnellula hyalina]TVY29563.1 Protein OPY2 [Lachnellula hyalina]
MAFSSASYNSLFRRCVVCGPESPSCPSCDSGFQCALLPPTCDECQKTQCVAAAAAATTTSSSSKSSSSGPNVGAIAGGVIGGILAIAAVTYLVWRFCIKTKRQQYEQEDWIEEQEEQTAAEKEFTMRRDARASTHTVASIASTVLTRASNIIQIAYIPGVTNRSAPSTPGLLVPPVPPIPIALSSASTTPRYEQEHFFMPGDLRDSTYSGISDRTSYARNSVASTIYGKNAVVSPVPAQTVIRGKAAVVSVKTTGGGTPGELTPPVPSVDYDKYGIGGPPSPAFSVGSTFLNNASAATQVRPQVVRVESGPKKTPQNSAPGDDVSMHESLLPRESHAITIIDDTPTMEQGPFKDPPVSRQKSNSSLSAVIEEATKKAKANGVERKGSPFGDENEMRE